MGWGSATEIFDAAVRVALQYAPHIPEHLKVEYDVPHVIVSSIVRDMYTQVDWGDWDTQDESEFYGHHLKHVMRALGEIEEE
jgi:hypothetical protein